MLAMSPLLHWRCRPHCAGIFALALAPLPALRWHLFPRAGIIASLRRRLPNCDAVTRRRCRAGVLAGAVLASLICPIAMQLTIRCYSTLRCRRVRSSAAMVTSLAC
jgi:hypothetical protein